MSEVPKRAHWKRFGMPGSEIDFLLLGGAFPFHLPEAHRAVGQGALLKLIPRMLRLCGAASPNSADEPPIRISFIKGFWARRVITLVAMEFTKH